MFEIIDTPSLYNQLTLTELSLTYANAFYLSVKEPYKCSQVYFSLVIDKVIPQEVGTLEFKGTTRDCSLYVYGNSEL